MYGEDIDLCYAVEKRGYENHYLGNLSILHFKGESTKFDLRYVNVFFEAMVLFQKKWKKKLEIIFSKPFIYIIKLIYVLCFTFSGNRKNAPTNVKVNTGNNNLLGEKCGVLKLHSEKGLDWIHIIGPAWTQEEMITSIENNKGIKHFIHAKGSGSIISYRATMSLI
jgi:hypothetical protein